MTSKPRWILLGCLAVVHLCGDLFVAELSESDLLPDLDFWSPFILGLLAGQISLLALWGSLGAGAWTIRFPVTLLLLVLLFCSLAETFLSIDFGPPQLWVAAYFSLLFGTVYFALQSPLWLAKRKLSWRIEEIGTSPSSIKKKPLQFSIRTLMLWTAAISVLLAVGRFIVPLNDLNYSSFSISTTEIFGLAIMIVVMAAVVFFTTFPSLAAILLLKNKKVLVFILVIYYLAFIALGPAFLIMAVSGAFGTRGISWDTFMEAFTIIAPFTIGALTMIWSHLWILHALGFRFKSGKDEPSNSQLPASEPASVGESR